MLKNEKHSNNFSKPIVFISIIGIILGVSVMILTLSIATGFQNEIKNKLLSFGSHIQIESMYQNNNNETSPISTLNSPIDSLSKSKDIIAVQKYAYKSAIIQSKNKTLSSNREVEGIIFKGLKNNNNFGFFELYLLEGKCPNFRIKKNDTIVLSKQTCKKLSIGINDRVSAFFISEGKPKQRNFVVGGIYETGLEKLDNQFGFISLNKIIEINKWGTSINLEINFSKDSSEAILSCNNKSNSGVFLYQWGNSSITKTNEISINTEIDTLFDLIAYEVDDINNKNLINIPDTLKISYNYVGKKFNFSNTEGSGQHYTGGYEIKLSDYKNYEFLQSEIKLLYGPQYSITNIEEKHDDMFSWLNLIYQNVYIIIALMVIVSIINMSSALLVLIVEKTKMIGILKSLGMKNKDLRKIFVIHGGFLISIGFVIGNAFAFLIICLQNNFHFLKLPQENYYLSEVPMHIPVSNILLLNIGAFLFCYLAMVLPSYISTKISPVKAIAAEI